jgi:CBS domain-containing protein
MSPRAASRLERFGFEAIYHYVGGIAEWKASGLPVEGTTSSVPKVSNATRADVPTCIPNESLGEVRRRGLEAGWEECVVLDCDRLVVGLLRSRAWDADHTQPVEEVMEPGPTTVRPDAALQPEVDRMKKRDTELVVVTTPRGELLGVTLRADAERLLAGEPPQRIWHACDGRPGQWRVSTTTS